MSADHLRQMKRRLGMAPPSSSLGLEPAAEKMDMLEKTLNAFRTEVDMKLKIIQQILTTRNEQVTVQKKLLDREQSLYNTLLAHWLNTADLAASGVSMNFSADLTESLDTEDLDFDFSDDNFDLTASPGDGTSSGAPATKKPRRRHRKISKVTKTEPRADGTTEVTEELDGASDPLDQRYEHNYDDDGDRDEEWVPSGNMETIEGEHGNEHNEVFLNAKSSHYLESAPHKTSIGFGVHVSTEFLAITRTSANTKNVYARNLFKHLYKPNEIVGHSLMGKTCNANKNDFPLPSIEPRRRDAIIEHSLQVFGIKLGSEEYRLARRDIKKTLSCLIKEMSKI